MLLGNEKLLTFRILGLSALLPSHSRNLGIGLLALMMRAKKYLYELGSLKLVLDLIATVMSYLELDLCAQLVVKILVLIALSLGSFAAFSQQVTHCWTTSLLLIRHDL